MNNYTRILSFARPFRRFFPLFLFSTIMGVVFEIFNISLVAPILDVLFNAKPEDTANIQTSLPDFYWGLEYFKSLGNYGKYLLLSNDDKIHALKLVCLVLITSVFFSNFFVFFSRFILAFVKARMIRKLRMAIYEKINHLPMAFFTNERKGDLISRMTNDVQEIENSIVATLNGSIKEPIQIIATFTILFMISPQMMMFSLIVLPVAGLGISQLTKRLRKKAKQGQDSLGKILNTIEETLSSMKIIYSFNAQRLMINKFLVENTRYERVLRSMDYKRGLSSPLSQFLGVSVFCVILYYGGTLVLNGKFLSPSQFFVFIILFANIISPIKALTSIFTDIQRGLVAGERIFEILDHEETIVDPKSGVSMSNFELNIKFENVSFGYTNKMVLEGINLEVQKGKTIALVGPSGGGKSTIADLIPRFYDVNQGSISIDGKDIKDAKLHDLRSLIGVVTQESILFNDSILNNIKFGKPNATMDEVIAAAKIANAHEFITQSEDGYDSMIGDRGSKLSGGQKQRLSIARAVLKNPPIMILDEATSALDTESEKLVQEALNNLMKDRTSIVIAHRLSTIQNADLIVVIKDGKIIEQGTHEQLIAQGDFYNKLVAIQTN
jgi:ATP-binding cassette, subfamily B, bacterial MsbA